MVVLGLSCLVCSCCRLKERPEKCERGENVERNGSVERVSLGAEVWIDMSFGWICGKLFLLL